MFCCLTMCWVQLSSISFFCVSLLPQSHHSSHFALVVCCCSTSHVRFPCVFGVACKRKETNVKKNDDHSPLLDCLYVVLVFPCGRCFYFSTLNSANSFPFYSCLQPQYFRLKKKLAQEQQKRWCGLAILVCSAQCAITLV